MEENSNIRQQIVENIRKHRENNKMTQKEVAERIGMSVRVYTNKESGNRPFNARDATKLAELYGITLEELVNGVKPEMSKAEDFGLSKEIVRSLRQFHDTHPPEAIQALDKCLSSRRFIDLLAIYFSLPETDESEEYQPPKKVRITKDGLYECSMTPASLKIVIETAMIRELYRIKYGE